MWVCVSVKRACSFCPAALIYFACLPRLDSIRSKSKGEAVGWWGGGAEGGIGGFEQLLPTFVRL